MINLKRGKYNQVTFYHQRDNMNTKHINQFIHKKVDFMIGGDKDKQKFRVFFNFLIWPTEENRVLFSLVKKVRIIK